MRKLVFWLTAVVLMLCGAALFTSCGNADLPAEEPEKPVVNDNPLVEQLSGEWYAECKVEGTVGEGYDAQHYDKVVMLCRFNPDGGGIWYRFPANGNKAVILDRDLYGGPFEYTSTEEGFVYVTASYPFTGKIRDKKLILLYRDGTIEGYDGIEEFVMTPATPEQRKYTDKLSLQAIGGWGGDRPGDIEGFDSPDGFNWNDDGMGDSDDDM